MSAPQDASTDFRDGQIWQDIENGKYTFAVAMISLLGGLGNGYTAQIIGGASMRMRDDPSFGEISPAAESVLNSSFYLGGMFGALCGGCLANKFGRRRTSLAGEVTVFVFALLQLVTSSAWGVALMRIGVGLGAGTCIVGKPLYVRELGPERHRPVLLALFSWSFSLGILTALCMDEAVPADQEGWWKVELAGIPCVGSLTLGLVVYFSLPESPYYNEKDAHFCMRETNAETGEQSCSLFEPFMKAGSVARRAVTLCVWMVVGQQLTGMGLLLSSTREIIGDLGGLSGAALTEFDITVGILHFAGVSLALCCLKLFSHRAMFLSSLALTSVCLALMALFFAVDGVPAAVHALAFCAAVFVYQMGTTPCFYVISALVFPDRVRPTGMGIAYALVYLGAMATSSLAPLAEQTDTFAFTCAAFALCGCASYSYCRDAANLPETFNVPTDKIWSLNGTETKGLIDARKGKQIDGGEPAAGYGGTI